ncbi:MAG: hypothetical protein AAF571_01185 [Verrucomicrobiota bacterium]
MKLTKYLSLVPYRIPINSSLLMKTAEEMLEQSAKVESLSEFLGWEEVPEELKAGFAAQKNGKELVRMLKENEKRKGLKAKRVQAGFPDLIVPRKGFGGWVQKKFRDPKEAQLPLGYDLFIWLQGSPRLALLTSMHDALLGFCSSAEPRRVEIDEVTDYQNPFCRIINRGDQAEMDRLQKALSSQLKSVDPQFIIDCCPGYVTQYDMKKGVAYYYGEPF